MSISLPYIPCYAEYDVANNPYQNIYIDLTMRCNMDCNYCYNPKRSKDDMCIFWPIPITDSGLNRSSILEHSDH